jgi:hypothetical protein
MVGRCISPQGFADRIMGLLDGSLSISRFPANFYLAFVRGQDPPFPGRILDGLKGDNNP